MYSVPLSYLVTILQIKLLFLEGSTSGFCFSVSFTFSYAVRKKKKQLQMHLIHALCRGKILAN